MQCVSCCVRVPRSSSWCEGWETLAAITQRGGVAVGGVQPALRAGLGPGHQQPGQPLETGIDVLAKDGRESVPLEGPGHPRRHPLQPGTGPRLASLLVVEVRDGEAARRSDRHEFGGDAPPGRRRGGHRSARLGWSCKASPGTEGDPDDRGEIGIGRADGEGRRGRLPARRGRGGAAAADGGRRRVPDRRGPSRALAGPVELPQRLP